MILIVISNVSLAEVIQELVKADRSASVIVKRVDRIEELLSFERAVELAKFVNQSSYTDLLGLAVNYLREDRDCVFTLGLLNFIEDLSQQFDALSNFEGELVV